MTNRFTSELASQAVNGRYDLVLIASRRVRELKNGHAPHVSPGGSEISTALLEIEQGFIGRDYLLKNPDIRNERQKRKPR